MSKEFYDIPDSNNILEKMNELTNLWETYTETLACRDKIKNIEINNVGLKEVVNRVFQRYDYFKHFHNGMHMSEFKEIALYAFWIIKLKPFSISVSEEYQTLALKINEEFAVYYIFSALNSFANSTNLNFKELFLTEQIYNEIVYTLLFRDVSKEALSLIVELLAHCVIEGLDSHIESMK